MCGFVGVFSYRDGSPVNPDLLAKAGRILSHRGPDASGIYKAGLVVFSHWRLSVLDLTPAGNQPMKSENGRYCLIYNGEVYNYSELKEKYRLESLGGFNSNTDTEVILRLFEQQGTESISELNGMFAFVIWDSFKSELTLTRDPFGIKPLFYYDDGYNFWFASEIKALLQSRAVEPEPDHHALHRYLQFDYIPGDITAFKGIREVRPGYWMKIDRNGRHRPRSYWSWPSKTVLSPSKAGSVSESLALLRQAVKRQLISDVPVGVMLSGGLDSSALTALMAEIRGNSDFHTFSLAFDEPSFDESRYARMVAERIGTSHHIIAVGPDSVWSAIRKQVAYIDEPYADGSAIPTFLLARKAREYVTVLLAGEGGDEVFAGYDTHLAYKVRELYLKFPGLLRRFLAGMAGRLPVSHRKLSLEFKLKRFVKAAENDPAGSHFYWRAVASPELIAEITGSFPSSEDQGEKIFRRAYSATPPHDPIGRLSIIDCLYHLPDDLMIKCDRMTMAFSLETRVPYTDLDLVRFALSLPDSIRLPGRRKKYLLREAMKGILPPQVINKKKVGLEMPYSGWFCCEWRKRAEEILLSPEAGCDGLLSPPAIAELWWEHLDRKADNGRIIWGLLNYIIWYDMYIRHRNLYMEELMPVRRPVELSLEKE